MNGLRELMASRNAKIRAAVYRAVNGSDVLTVADLAKRAGVEYSEASQAVKWLGEREYLSVDTSEGNYIVARGPRQRPGDDAAFASGEAPTVVLPRARSSPRGTVKRLATPIAPQEMNVVAGVQVTIQGRNFTLTFAEADKLYRLLQKVFPAAHS